MASTIDFRSRLQVAIREGAAGREILIGKMVALSVTELHNPPEEARDLLRPRDWIEVLNRRNASPAKPAGGGTTRPPAKAPRDKARAGKSAGYAHLAMLVVAIVLLGFAVEYAGPPATTLVLLNRPVSASAWPRCERLDVNVDGCVYVAGGHGGLSLERAATQLGLPLETLADANAHIGISPSQPLPPSEQIVVWRGRGLLTGAQ